MPGLATPTGRVLVSDFDGTMTRHDFYLLVRARWWDESEPDPWKAYLSGRLTHLEALNRFFARIPDDEAALDAVVQEMELDPSLPSALERVHHAGWSVVIASAGCDWYIRRLLKGVTVPFTLYANPGRFNPGRGMEMLLPASSPFFSPQTGIDKVGIVRDASARFAQVAFAGDGPPDLPAARLVSSQVRFARGWLGEALTREGEPYHQLRNWAELADRLLAGASSPA